MSRWGFTYTVFWIPDNVVDAAHSTADELWNKLPDLDPTSWSGDETK